ncbi:MAG: urease accessory protein UreE [Pseudomonadota bacterium]
MLEITRKLDQGGPVPAATLSLAWEQRQRSRLKVTLDDGRQAALLLPRGTALKDGDLLQATGGLVVAVRAAVEELTLAACAETLDLARACYHLGNRHAPVQIRADGVLYQRDHVLDDMLRGLGLEPRPVEAAFQPEAGAYHGQPGQAGPHGVPHVHHGREAKNC